MCFLLYMRNLYFYLFVLFIYSCNGIEDKLDKEAPLSILPLILHEGEEAVVNAIADSIDLKSDTLFFRIHIFMQDLSNRVGYVKIKNGKGVFTIPKGAACLKGQFYTLEDREERTYTRFIYDSKTNKEVINAYQLNTSEKKMKKELTNHPNNLAIYAQYLRRQHEDVYLGKTSDSIFYMEAKKYLSIVEQQANTEKASDMYALIVVNNYAKEYDKAEALLLEMIKKHSNSNFFIEAYNSYWIWSKMYRENPEKTEVFIDSLDTYIAKNIPYSPIGITNSLAPIKKKYYTDKVIAQNIEFFLKNVDSSNIAQKAFLINGLTKSNQVNKAKVEAQKYMNSVNNEEYQHFSISQKGKMEGFAKKGTQLGFAYQLLAEVSQAEKDYTQAITYLDSAYMSYQKDRQNNFIKNPITEALNLKASIQKKINQHDEALKTYETLYQETKDDRVLDSIKILFKETQQEKGFESYAKSLKEKVENKNNKPKKLATDFSIKDMSGYEIKLSEWKGRVVVLNFWANYCLPCAKEIPLLNKLWRETQTKDIIFLAVTKDTPLVVQRFAQRQKEMFSFSVLPNAKELSDVYDVNLVPTQIVINKKGEIVHRETGFGGNIDKLKQVVLEELAK